MGRARRTWFKVASSVYREPWTNDTLATLVRLSAYLNDRWARDGLTADEACRATLDRGALRTITGKGRSDIALKSLRYLADFVSISVRCRGDFIEIEWPKYAEFQGMAVQYCTKRGTAKVPTQDSRLSTQDSEGQKSAKSGKSRTPKPRASRAHKPDPEFENEGPPTRAVARRNGPFDPLVEIIAAAPDSTPEAPTLAPLANALSKLPGDRAQKLRWLHENEILLVSEAAKLNPPNKRTFNANLVSTAIRYYRQQYVERKPLPPRYESYDDARARRNAEWAENMIKGG